MLPEARIFQSLFLFILIILLLVLFSCFFPFFRLFFFLKTKRNGVNAITLSCGCGSVLKDMSEMASAARANHFDPVHKIARVFPKPDSITGNSIIETWPASPGFEFGIG